MAYYYIGGDESAKKNNDDSRMSLQKTFVLLWVLLGLSGFVFSMACFSKSGRAVDHVTGLVLSVLFGPFFWLFFILNKKYCR